MKTRILSGIIMLPLLILVFLGGAWLAAGCFIIGVMGVWEFYNCFKAAGVKPSYPIAVGSAAVLYGLYGASRIMGLSVSGGVTGQDYTLWVFLTVLASLLYLFKIDERKPEDALVTAVGIFYIIFFSFHVTLTDMTCGENGILVWLVFLTAFGTDIMAYFTGYFIGRHKLCPKISPKKTVEGSIGGILGSVVLCGVFGYFFAQDVLTHCLVIGALGGVISQFGDLTASIFKRKLGVKDYGKLIPGHGGILDRFDSVLFTAPLVYYYVVIFL